MVQTNIFMSIEQDRGLLLDCPESEHDAAITDINDWIFLVPLDLFPAKQSGKEICAFFQHRYGKADMVRAVCNWVAHDSP